MPESASRLAARKTRQMARELRLLQGRLSGPGGVNHSPQPQAESCPNTSPGEGLNTESVGYLDKVKEVTGAPGGLR